MLYQRFSADLPNPDTLARYQPRVMSRVYAGDNRLMAELATERRIFVPVGAIPDIVKQAFISAEDQNFAIHTGFDPIAIVRAGITDVMQYGSGRRPIGASTITQQVAKNMLLSNETSISRKVREIILAVRIEQSLSKDRILELYLNEIYLGLQAYGVASAAQAYFNKSLAELTLPEAAFLAVLPKAPNNYNPFRFPDAARVRRDWVIDRMADDKVITRAQATEAKAALISPAQFRRPETVTGGDYFAEDVRRWLVEKYGADMTTQGGLVVRTTLDPVLQAAADRALREGLVRYDQRRGGWRGAAARLELGAALRNGWATALAGTANPPGLPPEWRMAVVLEAGDTEAKLGILNRIAPGLPAQPVVLPMQMADLGWARPRVDDKLGLVPKKTSDIFRPGDLVMTELAPVTLAQGRVAARSERLLLRQIPVVQGALVSIDPANGRVLAMSGGWSFETSQFNRATQANRQPGSSFKPFVYLTAMQSGISPSQRFLDAPFVVDNGAAGKWRPSNYEQDFSGPVPVRVALEKSLNLITVRIADRVGMEKISQTAIAFHMVDSMPLVLPAALGAVETTVMREAGAYASLAAGGREVIPTLIDSVQDRNGAVIWRAASGECLGCGDPTAKPAISDDRKQISDAPSVFQLVTMLQGAVARGTGFPAGNGLGRAIAGKTGTTQDFSDTWFSGFTPDLVTIVWVGFDTPAPLGPNETGGMVAAPIWRDFMNVALKNRSKLTFPVPPGVTLGSWDSGAGTITDAFKPGQTPGGSTNLADPKSGSSPTTADAAARPSTGGVDSDLGGLY
ncbi:MAG: PBP1A family penicillin-binding protein [Acetobacteraceae bacterium]|nr:PBP1A family penicillin-binding protein [Acetobacteraceae bacterium]